MQSVFDFIAENDGTCLYVMFGVQCLLVFLGFPLLLAQCSSGEKRHSLSYGKWMLKWTLLSLVGKWMLETYDLVEIQQRIDESGKDVKKFDPYKLLHIPDDGSFDTPAIRESFDRLAAKYHPSKVNSEKVPYNKAIKRWKNLNKAFDTLTVPLAFENYQAYGDPDGLITISALRKGRPDWIFAEEFRPQLVMWAFVASIAALLAICTWRQQASVNTKSGVEEVSYENMKQMLQAILEDNPKSERTIGLSDADIIEIYQQSVEIMHLEESLNKKATFNDVVQFMIRRAAEQGGQPGGGGGCCGDEAPKTPESLIGAFMPKLAETIIDILSEAPFQGQASMTPEGGAAFKYRGETILTTVLAFSLRVLGGKLLEQRKIVVDVPAKAALGDSFNVKVRAEKLPFVKDSPGSGRRRLYIALVNLLDNSMQIQEVPAREQLVQADFKVMPSEKGVCGMRALILSGDGQIEKAPKDKTVTIE